MQAAQNFREWTQKFHVLVSCAELTCLWAKSCLLSFPQCYFVLSYVLLFNGFPFVLRKTFLSSEVTSWLRGFGFGLLLHISVEAWSTSFGVRSFLMLRIVSHYYVYPAVFGGHYREHPTTGWLMDTTQGVLFQFLIGIDTGLIYELGCSLMLMSLFVWWCVLSIICVGVCLVLLINH